MHGELYEVDDRKLAILDALEAHPILYERKLEQVYGSKKISIDHCIFQFVMDESGVTTEAWIYIIHKWDLCFTMLSNLRFPRWKEDFLDTCSDRLSTYSTDGAHGRPYLDRYL